MARAGAERRRTGARVGDGLARGADSAGAVERSAAAAAPARTARAVLLCLLLLAPAAAPSHADDDGIDPELVAALAERNLRAVEDAVDALAANGGPRALVVLRALQEGRLYKTAGAAMPDAAGEAAPARILVAIGAEADPAFADAVTGAAVPDSPAPERIRVSNRVRRALRDAVAKLSLGSSDARVRLAAARQFTASPEADLLPLIEAALASERSPRVATALEIARAAVAFNDVERSAAQRGEAAARLGNAGTPAARAALLGAYVEAGSTLAMVRDEAVAEIDAALARWRLLQNLWYGVSLGSVLLLAALGLAVTFGVMGVINMAHGEMVMLGAYTTFAVQQVLRSGAPGLIGASPLIALPAAFAVAALVGLAIERTVIRRLYGRPLETLLATFGISLILQQAVRTVFGASNRPVESVAWLSGAVELGGLAVTWNRLAILLLALAVLAGVAIALWRTPLGLQIRAVTQNRAMAEAMGIRSERIDMLTFALGSGIAGIAGVALAQIDNVSPNLGQGYIIDSFMVIVFGGVGNLLGTLAGAMTLGIANKLIEPAAGAVAAKVLILVFIILFIQFRPKGMFAQQGRAAE